MTHRAMSFETDGCTNRSTYITPGARASNGRVLLSSSTRTDPDCPKLKIGSRPPRQDTTRRLAASRDGANAVISSESLETEAREPDEPRRSSEAAVHRWARAV